jgi:hypothetical protein
MVVKLDIKEQHLNKVGTFLNQFNKWFVAACRYWLKGFGNEQGIYIYLLTNQRLNVLYTGVTNNLIRRVYEHKNKMVDGFTKQYNVDRLIYYEAYSEIYDAITKTN